MKRAATGSTGNLQLQDTGWCRADWHISAGALLYTMWGRGQSLHIDEEMTSCHSLSIDRWSM